MSTLLNLFYQQLEQQEIDYCLLRGDAQLPALPSAALDSADQSVEIDLLVEKTKIAHVQKMLSQLGFVALPNGGHAPHYFYVAYLPENDCWLKLDIVTEAIYGRPIRALQTDLAQGCLQTRRQQETFYVPAPEYEMVMLLLHCLLDKGDFKPAHKARLQALTSQIGDEPLMTVLLERYCTPMGNCAQLVASIRNREWAKLLRMQTAIANQLLQRDLLGTRVRQMKNRLLRKVNAKVNFRRPPAVNVAVMAPDGAGKSTVTEGLSRSFYFPVRTIYMGLYQKDGGGKRSLLARLGLAGRIIRQWGRYATARVYLAQRRMVIFDRYNYDALLTSSAPTSRRKQWRRWLLAHCCPAPNLVILLDAPGTLLFARKGEHTAALLEQQRQQYLDLSTQIPNMAVVDATQDSQQVRRAVTALIWRAYLQRQNSGRVASPDIPAISRKSMPVGSP